MREALQISKGDRPHRVGHRPPLTHKIGEHWTMEHTSKPPLEFLRVLTDERVEQFDSNVKRARDLSRTGR